MMIYICCITYWVDIIRLCDSKEYEIAWVASLTTFGLRGIVRIHARKFRTKYRCVPRC